jgi:hypothetical protein
MILYQRFTKLLTLSLYGCETWPLTQVIRNLWWTEWHCGRFPPPHRVFRSFDRLLHILRHPSSVGLSHSAHRGKNTCKTFSLGVYRFRTLKTYSCKGLSRTRQTGTMTSRNFRRNLALQVQDRAVLRVQDRTMRPVQDRTMLRVQDRTMRHRKRHRHALIHDKMCIMYNV